MKNLDIQSSLKQTALQTPISSECLFSTPDLFYLSKDIAPPLSKMPFKHYLRVGSCLACVYRVMDARGKFGEHKILK